MTFIAALRHDRISAPWIIDSPINGELFTLYVEKVLAPTLTRGEVVILDNLGSHKGKLARDAIRAKGAHLFFLPPYSPDLNPIEQVFAKLKHLIRTAEPRDVGGNLAKGRRTPRSLLQGGVRQLSQKPLPVTAGRAGRQLGLRLREGLTDAAEHRAGARGAVVEQPAPESGG